MSIDADLETFLASRPTIAALVGKQIYQDTPGKGSKLPRIVFSEVAAVNHNSLGGAGDTRETTWQIDCQSTSRDGRRELARAVRNVLNGYLGAMGETDEVSIELVNEIDDYDEPADCKTGVFRKIQDYQIISEDES